MSTIAFDQFALSPASRTSRSILAALSFRADGLSMLINEFLSGFLAEEVRYG